MKLSMMLSAVTVMALVSVPAQDWAKAGLEKSPRHLEWVKVKHGDREVNCFIAYPEAKDKATAVVVIHEIFGLSEDCIPISVPDLRPLGTNDNRANVRHNLFQVMRERDIGQSIGKLFNNRIISSHVGARFEKLSA